MLPFSLVFRRCLGGESKDNSFIVHRERAASSMDFVESTCPVPDTQRLWIVDPPLSIERAWFFWNRPSVVFLRAGRGGWRGVAFAITLRYSSRTRCISITTTHPATAARTSRPPGPTLPEYSMHRANVLNVLSKSSQKHGRTAVRPYGLGICPADAPEAWAGRPRQEDGARPT
jgi:hypothetical protein